MRLDGRLRLPFAVRQLAPGNIDKMPDVVVQGADVVFLCAPRRPP